MVKISGRNRLLEFSCKHSNAKKALDAWFYEAESADWKTPQDIKNRYSSADFLANNRVIFNIKGNHFRLVVKVRYQNGIVLIEWVGTHADYDKKRFED
jgi:mRNA interferase HigB